MKLYEFSIEIRDGESEYGYQQYVVAHGIADADKYAEEYMVDFWGEGSTVHEDDRWYWDEWGTRCARVDMVREVSNTIVPSTDGDQYELIFTIRGK